MGIDPKALDDESFALAFQQYAEGKEITGKKWRPDWKPGDANSVEVSKGFLLKSITELIKDVHSSAWPGGWPKDIHYSSSRRAYYEGGDVGAEIHYVRWLMNKPAINLLPEADVGVPFKVRATDTCEHIPVSDDKNDDEVLFVRLHKSRRGRLRLDSVDLDGHYTSSLIALDLSLMYRLMRGGPPFQGWPLMDRENWAWNNSHQFCGLDGELRKEPDGKEQKIFNSGGKLDDPIHGRKKFRSLKFGREGCPFKFTFYMV